MNEVTASLPSPQQDVLDWLRRTASDRIVVGQPGLGKTYLLNQLAESRPSTYWLDTPFLEKLRVGGVEPHALILVDDASVKLSLLKDLLEHRSRLSLQFEVAASVTPGGLSAVLKVLALAEPVQVRMLEGWTRREIRQLLLERGAIEDADLPKLVQLAATCPGRALTLFALRDRQILHGRLDESLPGILERMLGRDTTLFLALLGLGGRKGLGFGTCVTYAAQLQIQNIEAAASQLASAGLIEEGPSGRLLVQPPPLRAVGFYIPESARWVPPTGLEPFLRLHQSEADALDAILSLAPYFPPTRLEVPLSWLSAWGKADAWREFVARGERQASAALAHFPELIAAIPDDLLSVVPQKALEALLVEATRRPPSTEILVPLERWLLAGPVGQAALERIALTQDQVAAFRNRGGSSLVALRALCLTLFPRLFEDQEEDDEQLAGRLVRGWGLLTHLLSAELERGEWESLSHLLGLWWEKSRRPSRPRAKIWRALAEAAIRDLQPRCSKSQGIRDELAARAGDFGLSLETAA